MKLSSELLPFHLHRQSFSCTYSPPGGLKNTSISYFYLSTSSQLHYIVASILANAKKSTVFPVAWRHKIFHIQQGFLSKDGVWDRQVFDTARKSVLNRVNDSLRAIVVSKGKSDCHCMVLLN